MKKHYEGAAAYCAVHSSAYCLPRVNHREKNHQMNADRIGSNVHDSYREVIVFLTTAALGIGHRALLKAAIDRARVTEAAVAPVRCNQQQAAANRYPRFSIGRQTGLS